MNTSENKSFCILPWINISVDPDGNIVPCCTSSININKPDGSAYNLGHDNIEDIINSKEYVEIRQKMLNGETVSGCEECYVQESYGGKSLRQIHTELWHNNPLIEHKINSSVIPTTVEYFDLRFGNLCNLNCRSCGPKNSSQFAKELNEISQKNNKINNFIRIESYDHINDWYKTNTFDENIKSQIDNIKLLYITGGEPTLIEKNYEILEYLIDKGKASEITIHMNTNLTNVKPRLLNLISKFKYVLIFASVDGYESVQEYIRYPSNWSQIDKNIRSLLDLKSDNMSIIATPVVQNVNLENISDLFDYLEKLNKEAGKQIIHISPIILNNPYHLDLKYLPLEYKKQCWEKIENWIKNNCSFQRDSLLNYMSPVKAKCFDDIEYQHQLDKFREFTDIFDTHRNVKLSDINPSLYKILYK